MPKKKGKAKSSLEEDNVSEMREIEQSDRDIISYMDSGNASDVASEKTKEDDSSDDDEEGSDTSTLPPIDDPKELMKKLAKERLRKCVVFMKEFWKIILFLLQTGIIGGIGLLAYYMEFQDIFPWKHTVFDCNDQSINQHMNNFVFELFIFGENIDEQWVFLFSWMAPPGIMIVVEFFYSLHTGCALSHHMKTPLILRRTFRFIGNYFFGVIGCLVISKSIKLFTATPRPYFISVCQPNVTDCMEATEEICTSNNITELIDARTSFPSMPVGALSFACLFTGAYLHQMIKRSKAYVLQPLAATLFLIICLLGACIELGVKRSHWYDILAGFALGSLMAAYQVATLNFFVEKFQPPLPAKRDDTWMQTDPVSEPESDHEYPYEDIMMGKLPKRKKRKDLEDTSCFHRATSFDNSFQLDMARSMKMFRSMNNVWNSNKPPTLNLYPSVYDDGLPGIKEEVVESKTPTTLTVQNEIGKPTLKEIYTPKSSPISTRGDDGKEESVLRVTITSE